ncbi:glycosyltransferase [Betalipothrixvirus uzonense]|uniref:Putative glycosyltransferase n=1 Tax=Betalipothrixvirus uzonense TaxID=512792 RepID=B2CRM0_9VIRU|nr:glycosyltransferase [Acidianus filamentous virus 9]ACB37277.1 putative glycosyltransferase [Acidianus filamentous virus 9]
MKIALVRDFIDTSFGRQGKLLEKGLKELGHEVIPFDKNKTRKEDLPPGFNDYIYYTIYNTQLFWKGISHHGKNIVFEVADTDAVSHTALYFFRQQPVDEIVVPSQWSKNAFYTLKLPIPQPIYVIPHALNPDMFSYPPKEMPHPCVLAILPHSWDRKGGDVVVKVFQELMKAGYHFYPLILVSNMLEPRLRGLNAIKTPLPDPDYYSIFAGCDILFYPVRGGAFEIPVIEALALGLDVVVTEKGAWSEWVLSEEDAYWIKVGRKVKLWYTNPFHVGYFLDPDTEDAYQKLVIALANWSLDKKKENLENRAVLYRERYSYLNMAKEWEKIL